MTQGGGGPPLPPIQAFDVTNNPLLKCIQVDDESTANNDDEPYKFWKKDDVAVYSEDCD